MKLYLSCVFNAGSCFMITDPPRYKTGIELAGILIGLSSPYDSMISEK